HKRLVPFLLRPDQSFVDGRSLKEDLGKASAEWGALNREEQIRIKSERGSAPMENESSIVFQLWQKHRGEISKPVHPYILNVMVGDARFAEEQKVARPFREVLQDLMRESNTASDLSGAEIENLQRTHPGKDSSLFAVRTTKISKKRLLKMYPQ